MRNDRNKLRVPPSIPVFIHVSVFVYLGLLVLMEMLDALQQSTAAFQRIWPCREGDLSHITAAMLF